eukprot:GEMP01050809.1.p1 GENE.GEMP01050809.1~~GEMP01050809.1.p1  ORF type:complete len:298 (+),score=52.39 GEMP01050809.1:43-936(+)
MACPRGPLVGKWGQWSPRVVQILGLNPGPYTLQGSNTYLIGTGHSRILLDTGEGQPSYVPHLLEVMRRVGCTAISQIVITHWHYDHTGGIRDVLRIAKDAPVRKFTADPGNAFAFEKRMLDTDRDPLKNVDIQPLVDHEVIHVEGATLRVVHTPGHSFDHICLYLVEENALFSGDNVLGTGTSVFYNLTSYMRSLRAIEALTPRVIFPGHGPLIEDGLEKIRFYINHRQQRIDEVTAELTPTPVSLETIVARLYPDCKPNLLFGATGNTRFVLDFLAAQGIAEKVPHGWILKAPAAL